MNHTVKNPFARRFTFAALLLLATASTGCDTEYWWSRGQPPAVRTVLQRSEVRVNEALEQRSAARPEIAQVVKAVQQELLSTSKTLTVAAEEEQSAAALTEATAALKKVQESFLSLDGKLAITNRIPFHELASELRVFLSLAAEGQPVDDEAFALFSSRVLFFFAEELTLPPQA